MKSTKLRLVGGLILLFNLYLIGQFNITGIPVLLLTIGFGIGYEALIVRPTIKKPEKQNSPMGE